MYSFSQENTNANITFAVNVILNLSNDAINRNWHVVDQFTIHKRDRGVEHVFAMKQ